MNKTLALLTALTVGVLLAASAARPVKLRWNSNPPAESVLGYKLFKVEADNTNTLLATTSVTTVTSELETGDRVVLLAFNDAGESPLTAPLVIPSPSLDRAGWVATASSAETVREDNKAANAIDGDPQTIWHTTWGLTIAPHYLKLELPRAATLSGLRYLPRQDDGTNGVVTAFEIQTSMDGLVWTTGAEGVWVLDAVVKHTSLPTVVAKFVRFWGNDSRMAAAEVYLEGSYVPEPPTGFKVAVESSVDLQTWQVRDTLEYPRLEREFFRLRPVP